MAATPWIKAGFAGVLLDQALSPHMAAERSFSAIGTLQRRRIAVRTRPMRLRSLAFTGAWLLLGGCSVSLPVTDATARRATNAEAQHIRSTGEGFEGTGTFIIVTATVSRHTLRRIVRWQLYTHVRTSACGTEAISGVIDVPTVDGVPSNDFHALEDLLSAQSHRSEFQLAGLVVGRRSLDWRRQCLQLFGGSYTLQKITSEDVRVRWVD